jgi:hypothetical protein
MISKFDGLHDTVIALKPMVDKARRAGNPAPFQIWRGLEAETASCRGRCNNGVCAHCKVLGESGAKVAQMILDKLEGGK